MREKPGTLLAKQCVGVSKPRGPGDRPRLEEPPRLKDYPKSVTAASGEAGGPAGRTHTPDSVWAQSRVNQSYPTGVRGWG